MENNDLISQIIQFISAFFSKGAEPAVSVTIPLDKPVVSTPAVEAPVYKISKAEILMGRDTQYAIEYTDQISGNIDQLLVPINKLRDAYGKPMKVNSGWRPPEVNGSTPGAAAHSKHMIGLAVDISDPDGELMKWTLANLALLAELGLYMEDFRWTPNWCHYQVGPPTSGHRIFVPSANRALAPDKWNGDYDHSFDTAV